MTEDAVKIRITIGCVIGFVTGTVCGTMYVIRDWPKRRTHLEEDLGTAIVGTSMNAMLGALIGGCAGLTWPFSAFVSLPPALAVLILAE